ncbi:MAG: hypothetical protein ACREYC_27590 [Gammaproteobacteria bacterium]
MPRTKPSKAEPSFYSRGRELSEGARSKLIELLGYGKVDLLEESIRRQMPGMKISERKPGAPLRLTRDPTPQNPITGKDLGKIILGIETVLGIYVDGSDHLDHIPRPADYVATFNPIRRDAFKLLNTLCELTEYYREQLMLKGLVVHELTRELASFIDAATAVVKDFENRPSKGARKQNALMATIRQLRCIFREHYTGPKENRRKQGAFQYRTDWEEREHEFVELALRDAKIPPEGDKDFARLFRDRRSIPEERNAAPNAKKTRPAR